MGKTIMSKPVYKYLFLKLPNSLPVNVEVLPLVILAHKSAFCQLELVEQAFPDYS